MYSVVGCIPVVYYQNGSPALDSDTGPGSPPLYYRVAHFDDVAGRSRHIVLSQFKYNSDGMFVLIKNGSLMTSASESHSTRRLTLNISYLMCVICVEKCSV